MEHSTETTPLRLHPAGRESEDMLPRKTEEGAGAGGGSPPQGTHRQNQGATVQEFTHAPVGACLRYAIEYRWVEVVFLVVLLLIGQYSPFPQRHMYVPQAVILTGPHAGTALANNTAFSYPVVMDGHICSPYILSLCAGGHTHVCCDSLRANTHPYETVHNRQLSFLITILPLCLLVIRHLFYVYLDRRANQRNNSNYIYRREASSSHVMPEDPKPKPDTQTTNADYWQQLSSSSSSSSYYGRHTHHGGRHTHEDVGLCDSLIGYLFAIALTTVTTNVVKNAIGYPRPNHYALILVASNSVHTRLASNAWKSFPSGHSSLTMATLLYTTLILLHDINRAKTIAHSKRQWARSILVGCAWIPVFISIFVASTRVIDYWHSTTDVLAGLFLGAGIAISSYRHVVPKAEVWVKAKDHKGELLLNITDIMSLI